jgi:hypothetical protein
MALCTALHAKSRADSEWRAARKTVSVLQLVHSTSLILENA